MANQSIGLRGLFDLRPPSKGFAKLFAQVDNLALHHRIGMTILQRNP
jgi:hypothetical protein